MEINSVERLQVVFCFPLHNHMSRFILVSEAPPTPVRMRPDPLGRLLCV